MVIVELRPLENGAHRNQVLEAPFSPPDGWAVVPKELEQQATGYLPFIDLTVEDGNIVHVAQGIIPEPEPAPEPPPDLSARVESLEKDKADKTEVEAITAAIERGLSL